MRRVAPPAAIAARRTPGVAPDCDHGKRAFTAFPDEALNAQAYPRAMSTTSLASSIAAQGMMRASARLAGAADVIASRAPEIQPVLDVQAAKRDFQANAAVLRTADQMTGAVIDILA